MSGEPQFEPGDAASPFPTPLASDPHILAAQLAAVTWHPRHPPNPLAVIDMLLSARVLDRPVRAAILHLLADTADVSVQPAVLDRAGRTGVAVHAHDRDTRYTLIFDPATGHLLAAAQQRTAPDESLDIPAGFVTLYTLVLDVRWRTDFHE